MAEFTKRDIINKMREVSDDQGRFDLADVKRHFGLDTVKKLQRFDDLLNEAGQLGEVGLWTDPVVRGVIVKPKPWISSTELADRLLARWDANESESNPLQNGKTIRVSWAELSQVDDVLRRPESHWTVESLAEDIERAAEEWSGSEPESFYKNVARTLLQKKV